MDNSRATQPAGYGWRDFLRFFGRAAAVVFLAAVLVVVGSALYVYFRYGESRRNIRFVFDGLTADEKKLPAAATEIFQTPRWKKNRDAVVERMLLTKIHPYPRDEDKPYMSNTEWQLRWLCMSVLSKLYASEEERNALMWRDLYFGYSGYGLPFAARIYFHKSPHELNVEEVLQLWTLAKAPNRFIEKPDAFEQAALRDLAYWRSEVR